MYYVRRGINIPNGCNGLTDISGDDPGMNNQKTPTVLLLSPDGEFHSFGFTARDFYHDMDFRYLLQCHGLQVASFTMT